jgi:hypothetical protein
MNRLLYIPVRTRYRLSNPAPVGSRHHQIGKIVCSLLGQGLSPDAVFAQLRHMYPATVPDKEISDYVRWAVGKNFVPYTPGIRSGRLSRPTASTKPVDAEYTIRKFLKDFRAEEADFWHESHWKPPENWRRDVCMCLAGLYHTGELVNIVTDYVLENDAKAKPVGWGQVMERDEAMRFIRDNGVPSSKAGGWIRPNPIDGKRLVGAKGWTDANVTIFRYALVEFDTVPLDLQLSFLARLPLPINAIVTSGGRSVHAWVRVNATSLEAYRSKVDEMLRVLKPFGVDQNNKNPSRMSRLPGALRKVGAGEDGRQRLLYLAPDRTDSEPILGA